MTGFTMIVGEVPLTEPVETEMVWFPAVLNVTEKVACPPESGSGTGSAAFGSLLDTCSVPAKLETSLFESSSACTVMLTAVPDVTEPEAGDTENCVADAEGGGVPLPVPVPDVEGGVPLPLPPQLLSTVTASKAAEIRLRYRIFIPRCR